jgi:hypothetical protein
LRGSRIDTRQNTGSFTGSFTLPKAVDGMVVHRTRTPALTCGGHGVGIAASGSIYGLPTMPIAAIT